uniref:Cytochrome b6-f complex subunit 6 n=35 Tax=Isoetes TaxID=13838 RepID=A0A3G2BVZ3_9TRAC|nr:cytochrome b6/f complex subunit VI [Isoetes flaccida]YP_009498599.1 cytochrome b6/f complex subunit VI [Isoetes butleri]YP_009498683.1 cytochrome b6/f complex subunit VI [Isoetes melanospora]YP_009498767.1 cytochrome b6/f complex subunit VI [Isoetes nuttallii]YP_009498851.1 cytochrome b6/f complex subunit VI [Isoetes valida]YP_009499295.1 cytochrome b6/f complex subunit VI [Isoetes engelmannii]YP_009515174.1 cytochrome b6/f complex subunit VI [Isoetes cangae]YP_009515257.1 cytochrome b6/f
MSIIPSYFVFLLAALTPALVPLTGSNKIKLI